VRRLCLGSGSSPSRPRQTPSSTAAPSNGNSRASGSASPAFYSAVSRPASPPSRSCSGMIPRARSRPCSGTQISASSPSSAQSRARGVRRRPGLRSLPHRRALCRARTHEPARRHAASPHDHVLRRLRTRSGRPPGGASPLGRPVARGPPRASARGRRLGAREIPRRAWPSCGVMTGEMLRRRQSGGHASARFTHSCLESRHRARRWAHQVSPAPTCAIALCRPSGRARLAGP